MSNSRNLMSIFAIILGTTTCCLGLSSSFTSSMTALKYGDSCSWEAEQARQNLVKVMVDDNSIHKFATYRALRAFAQNITANDWTFCSAPSLFLCDQASLKCVCGDPGKAVLLPNADSSDYVVEVVNNQQKCRWNEDAACISEDIFTQLGQGSIVDSKCMQGTTCIAKATGQACSFQSLLIYVMSNYGYRGSRSQQTIMRDLFRGRVCTCKPDVIVNTIGDSYEAEDTETLSGYRYKRSVEAIDDGQVDLADAGVISPIFNYI